ncbi:MAG TPA: glycosyltransferase family 1 protein [Acidimicrobiia bacterium]|nr:glycosyltransferase family 1 protein [Acidimicrobiia bacterium]
MRNSEETSLRVAIDARLISGESGGVESVVVGLAHGLSQLTDGSEEYVFIAYEGLDTWIRGHIAGPCRVMTVPYRRPAIRRAWRAVSRSLPRVAASCLEAKRALLREPATNAVPAADATIEAAGFDVIHFPLQRGFRTAIPSIYHPHDLQHLHMPHFFTAEEYRSREIVYRTLCSTSTLVAVASRWVRNDVIASYQLPEEKVVVVPLAAPVDAYAKPSPVGISDIGYDLPTEYLLYPAATWPHKNHLRLLEALSLLRNQGIEVPLVCTGMKTGHFRTIERRIRRLQLSDQVQFLGVVSSKELVSLYAGARATVIPTEFEAASFPMWEAFRFGVPVACSNVTSLPEQAGDAAILFEPEDVQEIASAVQRLWTNEGLRGELIDRGHSRVDQFDWITTARTFRAHYRRIAGRAVSEEDRTLLERTSSI